MEEADYALKLLTVSRYSEKKREYFTFRFDKTLVAPAISVTWEFEGKTKKLPLIITDHTSTSVSGYITDSVDGDLLFSGTMGSITVEDEGTFWESPRVEKKKKPKDSTEMLTFTYREPLEINHAFPISTEYSGYNTGIYPFINRLADAGSSGLNLRKRVVKAWTLPGVLTPEIVDEARLQELFNDPWSLDSGSQNRCYMLGNEMIFLQANPVTKTIIRNQLSAVYTFAVESTVQNDTISSANLEQAKYGDLGVIRQLQTNTDWSNGLEVPTVSHLQQDLRLIYDEVKIDLQAEVASELRAFIPQRTQDRSIEDSYSLPMRNHNEVQ